MNSSVSIPSTTRIPLAPARKQTSGQSLAEIPTLFCLGKIESDFREANHEFDASDGLSATGRRNSVRQSSDRLLRIDAAQSGRSSRQSVDQSACPRIEQPQIEQRLSRLLRRTRPRPAAANIPQPVAPPVDDPPRADDLHANALLAAHSGDLITQLGVWSLHLDRREAGLDQRERELNARLRVWRQIQSHGT